MNVMNRSVSLGTKRIRDGHRISDRGLGLGDDSSGAPLLIHTFMVIREVVVATFLRVQGIALCLDPQGATGPAGR